MYICKSSRYPACVLLFSCNIPDGVLIDSVSRHLTPVIARNIVSGREVLSHEARTVWNTVVEESKIHQHCYKFISEYLLTDRGFRMMTSSEVLAHDLRFLDSIAVCTQCQTLIGHKYWPSLQQLWDRVPSIFSLPDWDTLKTQTHWGANDGLFNVSVFLFS